MPISNANEEKYYLVFTGQIKEGVALSVVKGKLKKFFNNQSDKVEQLFLKKKYILRKNLSKQDAIKFKKIFETTGARCFIYKMASSKSVSDKAPRQIKKQENNNINNDHRIDDLIKVTQFLVRVISFNQKMIWVLITLVVLSVIAWGSLFFIKSDRINASNKNKSDANNYTLEFKTKEGDFALEVKTYYPIKKIHLTKIKSALTDYYKNNKKYPISSNQGKGVDGLYTKWGKQGRNWIQGLVPDYIDSLPRDPRNTTDVEQQYLYKSNGQDYKLIAHGIQNINVVAAIDPLFIDPKRNKNAYGYWTERAKNW